MSLVIRPEHFSRSLSPDEARGLFKASITQVEIEAFTYCNRTCWFCPNSYIDRRSTNKYMDEALYLRILGDLASIDYSGVITYSRYNEPLADKIILTRIRQAREHLPNATLSTHTNGDYLDQEYLDELKAAGLNRLRVQVYLGNNEHFNDEVMRTRLVRRLKDLGLPYEATLVEPNVRYMATVQYPGMEVTFDARNFDAIGVDRGQTIAMPEVYERTAPCFVVFRHLYIDYDGSVVPCCNIRSDEPRHEPYIVDRLATGRSLFQAYANSPLADWRRGLVTFGKKEKPCDTCAYEVPPDTPELRAMSETVARDQGLR
jgi:hypothetical protein